MTDYTLVVDTVGQITLLGGEVRQGVILTGSTEAVRNAARFWAERVLIQKAPAEEDGS